MLREQAWHHLTGFPIFIICKLCTGPLVPALKVKRHEIKSDPTPFGFEGWPSKQMPSLDTFEDFEAIPSSTEDLSNSSDLEEDSHPSNGSNLYRVEGSFDTCFPDSLTLEEGDLVQFIQEGENGQWLVKKLVSEKTDWIPSSLLQPAESEANNSCRISNSDVYSDTHSSASTNSEMKVELNRSLTAGQKAGS
ncbi:PREDICTED: guanine nucleotide exchange factor DBS-like [Thamnophis sirtalis]|uniref:Guanine nucleotide exchange factor DBS-like n=1 Tax=Thamnophis sirtalis TaxID=35019 RepID=A0A6I9XDQ6_9SAUR|nr:PREDICTED: guanine nucleotide exchange factor DBS-like [Thamnophis sirtalis]